MEISNCRFSLSNQQLQIVNQSALIPLSSASLAASTALLGTSGMTHFTFPARISSCAMQQGLRERVSITGGAPPCSCHVPRAATRM